jgi:branched-chain amino acid transport system ATP-binding protein
MLLIEHDMNIVMPLCSRVQVIDDGKTLRIGSPEEVQADPAVVRSYLGSSFVAAVDA